MKLLCTIKNLNNLSVKKVIIRKFFQIIFFSNDMSYLDIYTATILGCDNVKDLNSLSLQLIFEQDSTSTQKVESYSHEDCTESFLNQVNCIRGVWGKECKIVEDQQECSDCLKKIDENIEIESHLLESDHKYLFVMQQKGDSLDEDLRSFALSGEFTKRNNKFKLGKPEEQIHERVELVNWIKTRVKFEKPLMFGNRFEYKLELTPQETVFVAPDFTCYLSPPVNYLVNTETALVSYKLGGQDEKSGLNNLVSSVARADRIYFDEWKTQHFISNRKMCRLLVNNITSDKSDFPIETMTMKFNIENASESGNSKFLLGMMMPIILTFGLDSGRIFEVEKYFPFNSQIPADIIWVIICLMNFYSFLLTVIRLDETQDSKIINFIRGVGFVFYITWVICIFMLFRVTSISLLNGLIDGLFFWISSVLLGITFISNAIFALCTGFVKRVKDNYPVKTFLRRWKV